ncbi:MAG: hypothetical protein U0Q14_08555 [Dermatophilaceae bacterium]
MKTMRVGLAVGGLAVALLAGGAAVSAAAPQGSTTFSAVGSDSGLGNGLGTGPAGSGLGWRGTGPGGQAGAARGGMLARLTPEQRSCLQAKGLTRPVGPLTLEQRRTLWASVKTAAESCNITLPKRAGRWLELTDTQLSCMQKAGITRPLGPLTQAQRAELRSALKAAATSCGLPLP